MIPYNLAGLVLFVASLGPGYVFIRVAERRSTRPPRSVFFEAVEMAIVGALASIVALVVVLLIGEWSRWIDLSALLDHGKRYATDHPVRNVTPQAQHSP